MALKVRKATTIKVAGRIRRKNRARKKLLGTGERPRMCVTRTNRSLFVQLVDDDKGLTVASAGTPKGKTANREIAVALGKEVAAKAKGLGIQGVIFDRSGNVYHGRIAAVAQGAREAGLQF